MDGEVARYPASSAVDAVAGIGSANGATTLWVLPRSGNLAYGYDGVTKASWHELLDASGGSAGRAWLQLRKKFADQRMGQAPRTMSREVFWSHVQRRPLVVEYRTQSTYAW